MKRTTAWTGYKVHLTETCEVERPNLITNVETTTAAVSDDAVTATIHNALAEHELLPDIHIADTGYVNSELFVDSQEQHQIELIGPTRSDNHWQAKEGTGFAAADFAIDWEQQEAICPGGKASVSWTPAIDKSKNHVVKIKFTTTDCQACPFRAQCTRSSPPRRTITLRPQPQHQALLAGRQREHTPQFKAEYAKRAGVEGTIAQGVRSFELRRSRYLGLAKTHLQHLMIAAAMNVVRMLNWLADGVRSSLPGITRRIITLGSACSRRPPSMRARRLPSSTNERQPCSKPMLRIQSGLSMGRRCCHPCPRRFGSIRQRKLGHPYSPKVLNKGKSMVSQLKLLPRNFIARQIKVYPPTNDVAIKKDIRFDV